MLQWRRTRRRGATVKTDMWNVKMSSSDFPPNRLTSSNIPRRRNKNKLAANKVFKYPREK